MLKDLIKKLEIAEMKASEIDAKFENDPENEELEKAFDKAYKAQFTASKKVIDYIVKLTGIEEKTARLMVNMKRDQLKAIAEKEV